MWLIHSLDPNKDLRTGDLRKRLIDHLRDPDALVEELGAKKSLAQLDLEKKVLERLITAGHKVVLQYKAGYYRIDIVIEGHQIAIECDGDRYHTLDSLKEDMERQSVLERLGWRFIRMRGTKFYRDPDRTIAAVFERLRELGAEPQSRTPEPAGLESNELIEPVIRRAAEIRAHWNAPATVRDFDERDDAPLSAGVEEEPQASHDFGRHAPGQETPSASLDEDNEDPVTGALPAVAKLESARQRPGAAERAVALARQNGLRVMDKRGGGGALWIVGGEEWAGVLRPLGFSFAPGGGRTSGYQPAWYLSTSA